MFERKPVQLTMCKRDHRMSEDMGRAGKKMWYFRLISEKNFSKKTSSGIKAALFHKVLLPLLESSLKQLFIPTYYSFPHF